MERREKFAILSAKARGILAGFALASLATGCGGGNDSDDTRPREFRGQGALLECESSKLITQTSGPSYIYVRANEGFTIERVDVRVVNTGQVSTDIAPLRSSDVVADTQRYVYPIPRDAVQLQTTIHAANQHKVCPEMVTPR